MNAKQIWQAALADLEQQVTRPNYQTWLRHTWAVAHEGDSFVIGAPNSFTAGWLEEKLLPQIRRSLAHVLGRAVDVRIVVGERPTRGKVGPARQAPEQSPEPASNGSDSDGPARGQPHQPVPIVQRATARTQRRYEPGDDAWVPNPRYSFASFVVGGSNELAFAACRAGAEGPGEAYNPLLIYGGVGLGKTHLLHAIGHTVIEQGLHVLYVTSERFTNELINSIAQRRTEEFRQRYRRVDVLLIDDIQFIAGKESTQEEFFHTFNALHESNRQIVLSSDRPPRAMAALEERLRSRFEWGLIADIQPPDFETRLAILRAKAQSRTVALPTDVLEFIAQRIPSNIRELEGALNRIVAYASLNHRQLTVEVAASALSDIVANPARRRLSAQQVIDAVARYYKLDLKALRGKAREKGIVVPRQVAMFLMREETNLPLVVIGRELGDRDHTTVLHGCEKIQGELEVNDRLRRDLSAIREALYALSL
jgi:chromosomal replication initiator protein